MRPIGRRASLVLPFLAAVSSPALGQMQPWVPYRLTHTGTGGFAYVSGGQLDEVGFCVELKNVSGDRRDVIGVRIPEPGGAAAAAAVAVAVVAVRLTRRRRCGGLFPDR